MTNTISERAMLATVHISVWTARKHDRAISKEVADNHGAHERAGRYHKRLFVYAEKLDNIQTIANRVRAMFYKYSLPWSDEGFRILPKEVYFEFTEALAKEKSLFWEAVNSFLDSYPSYIAAAREQQGTMFRESDYPPSTAVRKKFDLQFKVNPLPAGNDFRVELSEAHKALICEQIDADVRATIGAASRDLFNRAYEVVGHMASRLGDPDAIFRNTTVSNVAELADLLPRLNITKDPQLDRLAQEIKQHLCVYGANMLRESKVLRNSTAAKAHDIAQRISRAMDGEIAMGVDAVPTAPAVVAKPPASAAEVNASTVDSIMQQMLPYMPVAPAA